MSEQEECAACGGWGVVEGKDGMRETCFQCGGDGGYNKSILDKYIGWLPLLRIALLVVVLIVIKILT